MVKVNSVLLGSLNIKRKPSSALYYSIEKGSKLKIKPKKGRWMKEVDCIIAGIGSMGETFWFACQIHICIHTLNKN